MRARFLGRWIRTLPNILAKGTHPLLELGSARVQHVPDMVVEGLFIFFLPIIQGHTMRKNRIMRIGQDR